MEILSNNSSESGDSRRSSLGCNKSFLRFSSSGSSTKLVDAMRDTKGIQSTFTKYDVASKTLLYEANQTLNVYRKRESHEKERAEEEEKICELIAQLKQNLDEMRSISDDMNTIKDQKITSPRIVDQAKTYVLCVESFKSSLRQLQMDFQHCKHSKQRQDLFTLSKSPFQESPTVRRRAGGAAEISSGATETMLHSRKILLETVQRSAGTMGLLANSSGSIQNNQEELVEQNSLISVSKKLLGKYGKREWTDKILICLAIIFFLACVMYVVQKRLF